MATERFGGNGQAPGSTATRRPRATRTSEPGTALRVVPTSAAAPTPTLVTRLDRWAAMVPHRNALHGGQPDSLVTWTWGEYRDTIHQVGRALIALGVGRQEAVAIIGENRPEWLFADLGIVAAGAVPAPIYVTNTAEQVAWVVNHSEARFLIADSAEQYAKLVEQRDHLPLLERVILMDDVPDRDPAWTLSWRDFLSLGHLGDAGELRRRIVGAAPDDLTLLCYTSGTTGEPKGVMITHAGLNAIGEAVRRRYGYSALTERYVSYLPLCHVAEHMSTIALQAEVGSEVFMCSDLLQVKEFLPVARPTIFLAVPRVWEKFEAALRSRLAEATGVKARLAEWAITTEAKAFADDVAAGRRRGSARRNVANRLVLDKVKQALGLDATWLCLSGSAPMNPETADFFASLGLPIHDVYGMTETTAILTSAPLGVPRSGTVGQPVDCVDLRIAEDGEVLARGPAMTPGYFRDARQTGELIDDEGWLHTGDVGHLDGDGFLHITDRKKDLFKTSGGKYVAPQVLEARLKSIPGIGQAVAVGDGQRFIAALVALDPENAPRVAQELGIATTDVASLATDPAMIAYVDDRVRAVNGGLARYEQVKKVAILPQELSIEAGELTPTLKLKRRAIAANHRELIDSLFA